MKKNLVFVFGLCALALVTSCKSRESAYRQAYEQAMAQDKTTQDEQQVVTEVVQTPTTTVTPVTPTTPTTPVTVDNSDVRELKGSVSVISGAGLKTYSVVVGSFVTKLYADKLKERLQGEGYDARIVQTNETSNVATGMYRVIASSFDDKASAVQSRNTLKASFPDAWLLYRK